MLGKGLKRKLEPEEEDGVMKMEASSTGYWFQRQTVLNLSLLKLHTRPGHGEPDLARRVLITNTLRHIQDELRGEECVSTPQTPSAPVTKDSFSTALAEIEALCPTVGITALFSTSDQDGPDFNSGADSGNSGEPRDPDPDLSEMHSIVDSDSALFTSSHAPSYLADLSLDDFLFTEIDNFLFDSSSLSVSMVTEDLVKTLAGYGNGGTSQSALPSKFDLNELDHVMEVLVGS
ncbi:SERTA domain-containing protein 2 [Pimephales promelas]|uniref:SERTA domain-containing protein 2 n=1 Tax=Pimephales promelas TaxID=90988 RepID=UPI001955AAE3|nr:SERTA domain-containing protein 2 [Pimephales promelas]KAG1955898.1 cell division cycle-associated protein [Pimephales promelas]